MDNERANMWRTLIKAPNIDQFSLAQLRQRSFVCSKHFRSNDYKNIESRSLNKTALPSLHLDISDDSAASKSSPTQLLVVKEIITTAPATSDDDTVKVDIINMHVNAGTDEDGDDGSDEDELELPTQSQSPPIKRKCGSMLEEQTAHDEELNISMNQVSSSTKTTINPQPKKYLAASSSSSSTGRQPYRLINVDIMKSHQSKQLLCGGGGGDGGGSIAPDDPNIESVQPISFVNEDDLLEAHILLEPNNQLENEENADYTERFFINEKIDVVVESVAAAADQECNSKIQNGTNQTFLANCVFN